MKTYEEFKASAITCAKNLIVKEDRTFIKVTILTQRNEDYLYFTEYDKDCKHIVWSTDAINLHEIAKLCLNKMGNNAIKKYLKDCVKKIIYTPIESKNNKEVK